MKREILLGVLFVGCAPGVEQQEKPAPQAGAEESPEGAEGSPGPGSRPSTPPSEAAGAERRTAGTAPQETAPESAEPTLPPAPEPSQSLGESSPLPFEQLEPGLWLGRGDIPREDGRRVRFNVAKISPGRHGVEVIAQPPSEKATGRSLRAYQKAHNAKVVLSGGFLKSFSPPLPLGLVKQGGSVINRAITRPGLLNGVFAITAQGPRIVEFSAEQPRIDRWEDCIQSGPLLVLADSAATARIRPQRKDEKVLVSEPFRRSFVAIDRSGNILLGLTGEVSLPDLARILARPSSAGGLDCSAALNLTGHVNAGLVVAAGNTRETFGDQYTRFPNVIAVK